MKNNKNENNSRRDFLKTGFAAVIAGTVCFSFGGLKEALAAAKKADKPLLSANSLNALIPDKANDQYFKLAKQALNDPLAFLHEYFYITPTQKEGLASLTESDWGRIKKGIQAVINKKYNFVVTFSSLSPKRSSLMGNAEILNAGFTRKNWEITVEAEGGATTEGGFKGSVSVKAKGTC